MKKMVMVVGMMLLLGNGVSEAKTNPHREQNLNATNVEMNLPLVYGLVGAVTLVAFGSMGYLFCKPLGEKQSIKS